MFFFFTKRKASKRPKIGKSLISAIEIKIVPNVFFQQIKCWGKKIAGVSVWCFILSNILKICSLSVKKTKKSDHGLHQHKLLGWIFFLPQMSNLDFYNASDSISVPPPPHPPCLHLSLDEVMLGMIGPSSQIKPRSPPHFYSPGIHYAKRAVVSDGIFYFIITNRRVNN